jgi:hypothetical protein
LDRSCEYPTGLEFLVFGSFRLFFLFSVFAVLDTRWMARGFNSIVQRYLDTLGGSVLLFYVLLETGSFTTDMAVAKTV